MNQIFYYTFITNILIVIVNSELTNVIEIENGKIVGLKQQTIEQNKTFFAYRGIPYAEPPIGALRFEPPVPAKPWNGTLMALEDRNMCPQFLDYPSYTGQEDCLYLSVYVPEIANPSNLLPVMILVHGGTYIHQDGSYERYGPDYFLDQDVIVVQFNYRLGFLGFASSGDLNLPGNNGLKDQVLAMKWVQQNIEKFNGDKNKVTIFGESAGSTAISYHLQSNLTKGLFHGAIMQSGSSLCSWSLSRDPSAAFHSIGSMINIFKTTKNFNTLELKQSLKNISVVLLTIIAEFYQLLTVPIYKGPTEGFRFGPVSEPVHEGAFFSGNSHELFKTGQFHQVPTIIGFTSGEANICLSCIELSSIYLFITHIYITLYILFNIKNLQPPSLKPNATDLINVNREIIEEYWPNYIESVVDLNKQWNQITEFVTDDMFERPIREQVLQMSKYSPVYYYKFSYIGKLGEVSYNDKKTVTHGDELFYLFRYDGREATEMDKIIRSRTVKLWTNFAKFGNPTPNKEALLDNVVWTKTGPNIDNLAYLEIDRNLTFVNPKREKMLFWDYIFNKYGNGPFDTY